MARGMFFSSLKIQIRNPLSFPDDTPCSPGDPLDVMRSIIDRDIARLEESIRSLKSRRNDLSPICRLPVEILCNILFSHCNIISHTEDNSIYLRRSTESWTNFSQVSRYWRSLALTWGKASLFIMFMFS
jgi:hypothetical protein